MKVVLDKQEIQEAVQCYVNIVLGITSNFNSETFISFEKYYQRIVKRTGNKYKKWINLTVYELL